MNETRTNLRVLEPSRKTLHSGEVFTMQFPDARYLFGRLISTEATVGVYVPMQLIYVIRTRSAIKELPRRSELKADQLLLPPMVTNRLPWTRGYFENVGHLPFKPGDLLPQHCFYDSLRDKYFDEHANELSGPFPPVGDFTLRSIHRPARYTPPGAPKRTLKIRLGYTREPSD